MESRRRARAIAFLLIGAVLLVAGLFWPTITVTKLGFFSDTYSIYLFVVRLFRDGDYLLFVIVLSFSILFPAAKIAAGFWFLFGGVRGGISGRIGRGLIQLGRFSMADVFLVALSVFLIKSSQFANVEVHWGVFIYGLSVAAVALAARDLKTRTEASS